MEPLFIQKFLPEEIFNLVNSYCIIKYSNQKNFDPDAQALSLIGDYGDPLMETIMDMSTPVIEQNVGKKLFPTNSYFRIYDKGSDLKCHTDRGSCEYTVALCLGADPFDVPYEIFVGEEDETSDYKYFRGKEFKRFKINYKFPMMPNSALIFQGQDTYHWREYCTHDHFMTVFLHYVDQDGEYAHRKFDGREMLGGVKNMEFKDD